MGSDIHKVPLYFYGHEILVNIDNDSIAKDLHHDFHYFLTKDDTPHRSKRTFNITVTCNGNKPDWKRAIYSSDKAKVYAAPGKHNRALFFDCVWVDYRFYDGTCNIFYEHKEFAYEALYYVVLAFVTECLDRDGWHRVHGACLVQGNAGILLMGRSGMGKSTLATALLDDRRMLILSDDTPLIGVRSEFRAFPQRIATNEKPHVSEEFVRVFKRALFGSKYVVSMAAYTDRIASSASANIVLLLERSEAGTANVQPVTKLRLVWPLIKWLVVGYEVPIAFELYLRWHPVDLFAKAKILFHRVLVGLRLIRSARVARVQLSGSVDESVKVVAQYLDDCQRLDKMVNARNTSRSQE